MGEIGEEVSQWVAGVLRDLPRAERLTALRDLQLWVQTRLAEEWAGSDYHNGQPVVKREKA